MTSSPRPPRILRLDPQQADQDDAARLRSIATRGPDAPNWLICIRQPTRRASCQPLIQSAICFSSYQNTRKGCAMIADKGRANRE